ncbi:cell division inhibitor SepF [Frankia sp. Hr75.2]|nr:cell division inhibitor SepF [Frankia sp. Hr75.2]
MPPLARLTKGTPMDATTPRKARARATVPIVAPTNYNDFSQPVDRLRDGIPMLVDLEHGGETLERRFLDFAAGAVYALAGHIERIAPHAYLVVPAGVELPAEDVHHLRETYLGRGHSTAPGISVRRS